MSPLTSIPIIQRFKTDQSGATATEYIILLILIACVAIAVVKLFGETIKSKFEAANEGVQTEVVF